MNPDPFFWNSTQTLKKSFEGIDMLMNKILVKLVGIKVYVKKKT